jgi:hypothetical protein
MHRGPNRARGKQASPANFGSLPAPPSQLATGLAATLFQKPSFRQKLCFRLLAAASFLARMNRSQLK